MSAVVGYLVSLMTATALAVTVVVFSRKALRQLLVELCGNPARAEYWTTFSGLFLVLCTLYGALMSMPAANSRVGWEHAELIAALSTFRAGVLGLLLASMGIAFVLFRFVARFETREGTTHADRD